MPDYEEHLIVASVLGVIASMFYFSAFAPAMPVNDVFGLSIAMWGMVMVGGVLPDTDHDSSKPRRLLNGFLMLGVAVLVFLVVGGVTGVSNASDLRILTGGFAAFLSLALAFHIVPSVVNWVMPPHRTVTHWPPFWALVLLGPAKLIWDGHYQLAGVPHVVEIAFVVPALVALFFGTTIHIVMDGGGILAEEIERLHSSLY